jgi:hypothetical protein
MEMVDRLEGWQKDPITRAAATYSSRVPKLFSITEISSPSQPFSSI